jgi:Pentapeptide repeats (8 copies)
VAREPQTARELAVLLLRATFLPGWQPTAGQALVWVIRGAVVLGVFVLIAFAVDKTLWGWLDLLIVPAVLAIGGYLFNSSQNQATQRAAERRAQDEALQAYLDQIGQLLLEKGLRRSVENGGENSGEARVLARARTLSVLRMLNPERKTNVVLFLQEASVIQGSPLDSDPEPIIPLFEADLSGTKLNNTNLVGVDLHDAKLIGANLSGADLRGAKLYSVYEVADLSGADLSGASLSDANLTRAIIKNADLREADLTGVSLQGANLEGANLEGAQLDEEQLAYCASLKGAIMPDGRKYEDWLKSKGSGEDEDHTDPS